MTLRIALQQGSDLLREGGIADPRLTAEVLLLHALRRERVYLYSHPEHELTELEWIHYGRYLHQRLEGMPTQYVTRRQEFFGRDFHVRSGVLIPRPETELLIEHALLLPERPRRVLDIGVGSGAIAVTLALELSCRVVATDISAEALTIARENASRWEAPVGLVQCSYASALAGKFDLVVSNPPYISEAEYATLQREVREHEPRAALVGGLSGTEPYEEIVPDAARLLSQGGWLLLELGHDAEAGVRAALGSGWIDVEVAPDLAGIPRVLKARWPH